MGGARDWQEKAEGVGDGGDGAGGGAAAFAVGLDLDAGGVAGAAGVGVGCDGLGEAIEAVEACPAESEPGGEGEAGRSGEDGEGEVGVFEGGATDEGAEEATEVCDADRHGADGLLGGGGGGEGVGDVEGREVVGGEEARGAEVVDEAAERVFGGGEEVVDESAVGAGACHDEEVARGLRRWGSGR